MRICHLRIENFRGIRQAEIPIPSHCAFLGPNNCGKTTIANALALLLGHGRWLYNISEYDFFGGNPSPDSRFTIIGTLTELHKSNDPSEIPEWFNMDRGARVAWWHETERMISYDAARPADAELAVEIAVSGRYDDDLCEFEFRRYFYDGATDPFTDTFVPFPAKLLSQIGFFLIPSLRHWDWILSFGSSQFMRLLRESGVVPAETINAFKEEMRNPASRIENDGPFKSLLESLESELRSFTLLPQSSNVVYRTTQLSIRSVLESLVPHIRNGDESILPFSKQGSGFASIQLLLMLLQFAEKRKTLDQNTIFVAEEPELHLQPALQRRLINRLRAYSNQTIVTTHSSHIASMFMPSEVVHLTNAMGTVQPRIIYQGNIGESDLPNQVRQLYLRDRTNFYNALLGQYILVPEGKWDWQWLRLWINVAEATATEEHDLGDVEPEWSLSAIEVIHTSNSAVLQFIRELRRFRNDVYALIDGDNEGNQKYRRILEINERYRPKVVIQFGENGEIEDLAAWVLEPMIASPGEFLESVLVDIPKPWTVQKLGKQLKVCDHEGHRHKEDWELHENLAWEAYGYQDCRKRIVAFLSDIARICAGHDPRLPGWRLPDNPAIQFPRYIAEFIHNE